MKKLIIKIIIIVPFLLVTSCLGGAKDNNSLKIRVVSLQGKFKPVKIITPDLNIKALRKQGIYKPKYIEISENKDKVTKKQNYFKDSFYDKKYNKKDLDNALNKSKKSQNIVYENRLKTKSSSALGEKKDVSKKIKDRNKSPQKTTYALDTAKANKTDKEFAKENNAPKSKNIKSSTQIQFNLANNSKKEIKEIKKDGKNYYIQVGAFKNKVNAKRSLNYMKKFHKGAVKYKKLKSGVNYKVVLGPFSKRRDAQNLYKKITDNGHNVIIIKENY